MKLKFIITANTSPAVLKIMADTLRNLSALEVETAVEAAPAEVAAVTAADPATPAEPTTRKRRTVPATTPAAEPAAAAAAEPHPTEQVPTVEAAAATVVAATPATPAATGEIPNVNKKASIVAGQIGPEKVKAKIAELGAKLIANLTPEAKVEFEAWLDAQSAAWAKGE